MDANRDAGILRTYHGGPSPAPLIAADGASAGPSNRGTGGLPGGIAVPGTALVSSSSQAPKHLLPQPAPQDPQRNFRFFDNRQKYLLFVNTCSEKWVVAHRVGQELINIHPRPPPVRPFDSPIADGTVLPPLTRPTPDPF